jgi:hypothetical protein
VGISRKLSVRFALGSLAFLLALSPQYLFASSVGLAPINVQLGELDCSADTREPKKSACTSCESAYKEVKDAVPGQLSTAKAEDARLATQASRQVASTGQRGAVQTRINRTGQNDTSTLNQQGRDGLKKRADNACALADQLDSCADKIEESCSQDFSKKNVADAAAASCRAAAQQAKGICTQMRGAAGQMNNNGEDANKKGEGMGQMPQMPQMPKGEEKPEEKQASGISERKDLAQKIGGVGNSSPGNSNLFGIPVKSKEKALASGGAFGGGGAFTGRSKALRDSAISSTGASNGAGFAGKFDGASGGGGGGNSSGASRMPSSDTDKIAAKDHPDAKGFEIPIGAGGARPNFIGVGGGNQRETLGDLADAVNVDGEEGAEDEVEGDDASEEEQAAAIANSEESVFDRVSLKIRDVSRRHML